MSLRTITVRELIAILEGEDPDMPVVFTADYGDRGHTAQALPIKGSIDAEIFTESAYSNSGYALADNDADVDYDDRVLVIR